MPSATTNKPKCSAFELSVRSPWAAKRLSSFGLCWRLMPGLERVPTTRLILRPVNCSTGGPGNAGAVLISSPVYGSVLSNSTCPFLNWPGDISLVGRSYIEAAGTSQGQVVIALEQGAVMMEGELPSPAIPLPPVKVESGNLHRIYQLAARADHNW